MKNLDFLGTKPVFFINGKTSSKTTFGGLLSVISALIILAASGYFIQMLFSRSSFNVLLSEDFNPNPTKSWNEPEFSVMLQNRLLADIPEKDRIYGITAQTWCNKPVAQPDGSVKQVTEILPVKLERCDVKRNFANSTDLWRDQKLINDSYCITPGQNISSIKLFGENDYCGVVFWIHKCQNSTTKKDCYPDDVLTKELQNIFVLTRFKDYYFDHNLLGETGIPYIYSDLQQASISAYKRAWYLFRNVEYESDEGFILPESVTNRYTNLAGTREATDLRASPTIPGSFMVISLNMYQLKQKFMRKFYKAQNMMADLGGLLKGVLMLATILNFYFSEKLYYNEIINNNIYNYEENEFFFEKERGKKKGKIIRIQSSVSFEINNVIASSPSKANKREKREKSSDYKIERLEKDTETAIHSPSTKSPLHSSKKGTHIHSKKIRSSEELGKRQFTLSLQEIILPVFCIKAKSFSDRKMKLFYELKAIIKRQLDLNTLIKTQNSVDKLTYIFVSKKDKVLLDNCINPYYSKSSARGTIDKQDNFLQILETNYKNLLNL